MNKMVPRRVPRFWAGSRERIPLWKAKVYSMDERVALVCRATERKWKGFGFSSSFFWFRITDKRGDSSHVFEWTLDTTPECGDHPEDPQSFDCLCETLEWLLTMTDGDIIATLEAR